MTYIEGLRAKGHKVISRIAGCVLLLVVLCSGSAAQRAAELRRPVSPSDPNLGRIFFDLVKKLLRDSYYDRNFDGVDVEKNHASAEEKLRSMTGMGDMFLNVSEALMALDDPHTYLLPPPRVREPEYGFTAMMFGDRCLVTYVRPESGAYTRGLRAGDEIVGFGAVAPNRRNLWKIKLTLYALNPLTIIPLEIKGLDGERRRIEIEAAFVSGKERADAAEKLAQEERARPVSCKDLSPDLIVCKIGTLAVKKDALKDLYNRMSQKKKVVLDLRGCREGIEDTLLDFTGHFFGKDVVAYRKRDRREEKERIARGRGDAFGGDVAVIVDSRSAGASELFARIIQLENRGKVFGDVSAGLVTSSDVLIVQVPRYLGQQPGMDVLALMGISVADAIMRDGNRLVRTGVIPDEAIAPNGLAIRERLDPVLSHVVGKMGLRISPKQAGAIGFLTFETFEGIEVPSKPTKQEVRTTDTILTN
jgi:C-terminal processing protease CtpA/Prc